MDFFVLSNRLFFNYSLDYRRFFTKNCPRNYDVVSIKLRPAFLIKVWNYDIRFDRGFEKLRPNYDPHILFCVVMFRLFWATLWETMRDRERSVSETLRDWLWENLRDLALTYMFEDMSLGTKQRFWNKTCKMHVLTELDNMHKGHVDKRGDQLCRLTLDGSGGLHGMHVPVHILWTHGYMCMHACSYHAFGEVTNHPQIVFQHVDLMKMNWTIQLWETLRASRCFVWLSLLSWLHELSQVEVQKLPGVIVSNSHELETWTWTTLDFGLHGCASFHLG